LALCLRAERGGLLALGVQVRPGFLPLRTGHAGIGRQRRHALFRDEAGLAQRLDARQVELAALQVSLCRVQSGLAGGDQTVLLGQAAARLGELGLVYRQVRAACSSARRKSPASSVTSRSPLSTCWLSSTCTRSMRAANWLETRVISPCT